MQEIYLDGEKLSCDFHQYLQDALSLPDYYGKNLDALYDCLTDIGKDTKIVIARSELADRALIEVFCEAEEENPCIVLELAVS